MEGNEIIDNLPAHLRRYICEQDYSSYTPIDQAVWRYVMRINVHHLKEVAHESYLEGLKKAGLEIEHIAHMYGMNRILKEIGWAAVAVDGFIPPSVFMEFQAHKVLVIAADIRQLKHIEYTPAPDIIHEAAGHAPIIADPEYSRYLRYFGEIGSKAISSAKDYELYEAIRHLSIIKEYPFTPPESILEAEKRIDEIQAGMGEPSEMALIRRLHWWTVEYGLIGTLENPKIYGAGLLSSIGESVSCLRPEVKKIPYSIEAINYEFDITKPQPQLFITPDFATLTRVLDEFANTMALRRGGSYGLQRAIESENIATAELSSGLQISGNFTRVIQSADGTPAVFISKGPTAFAYDNRQLEDHHKSAHRNGLVIPVGKLKSTNLPPELFTRSDLEDFHLVEGQRITLEFRSGIVIKGYLQQIELLPNDRPGIIYIRDAELTLQDGEMISVKDMYLPLAESVKSVYSGAADRVAFNDLPPVPTEHTYKVTYDARTRRLQQMYGEVREIRHTGLKRDKLPAIFKALKQQYPEDWLLSLELYELLHIYNEYSGLASEVRSRLDELSISNPEYRLLINNGLELIEQAPADIVHG